MQRATTKPKVRINFAITEEAHRLLHGLAAANGQSMNATLEVIIRQAAKHGVNLQTAADDKQDKPLAVD